MSWIEFLSMLVGIITGLLSIAEKYKDYIKSKKSSKKDPSASLPASDGSDDNIEK